MQDEILRYGRLQNGATTESVPVRRPRQAATGPTTSRPFHCRLRGNCDERLSIASCRRTGSIRPVGLTLFHAYNPR